jgi:hypothetical protein
MVCSLFDCPFAVLCHILKTSGKPNKVYQPMHAYCHLQIFPFHQ